MTTHALERRPRLQLASRELLLIVVACLIPLAAYTLAWGPGWLLDYKYRDNWSYTKYFLDWTSSDPVLRGSMATDYKGTRIAWIAPGFVAYQLFGPLIGGVVLNVAVAIATILATLTATSRLFGRAPGALATIVLSAFGGFYASGLPGFWSYHGGICSLFFTLFLLALIELARRPRSRRWALLAGAMGTLAVITTTNYLVALPWALLFWLLLRGRPALTELVTSGASGACGAALAFLALVAANVAAGGNAWFLAPLISATMSVASGSTPRPPFTEWLPYATHLVLPFLIVVGGILTHALRARPDRPLDDDLRALGAAFAGFVGLLATHVLLHARVGHFLHEPYFNYVLMAPMSLVLAGIIRCLPRMASQPWHLPGDAYLLLAVILIVPQLVLGYRALSAVDGQLESVLSPLYVAAAMVESALLGIVALAILASRRGRHWLGLAALCLGLAWALINPNRELVDLPSACRLEHDNFLLVMDVATWLAGRGLHADPRSWFSTDDVLPRADGCPDAPLGPTYLAVEQAAMIFQVTSPLPLPSRIAELPPLSMRNQIEDRRRVFLIVLSTPERAPTLDQELIDWASAAQVYVRPRPVRRQTFTRGPLSLTVQVYGTGQRARRFTGDVDD